MKQRQVKRSIMKFSLFLVFLMLFGLITSCSQEKEVGPPEDVIKEAKLRTESIIDKVKLADETVKGDPELVEEYWDEESESYVLKYYVETVYGAAVTDSPTARITQEGNAWKYEFVFDKPYELIIEVNE